MSKNIVILTISIVIAISISISVGVYVGSSNDLQLKPNQETVGIERDGATLPEF